METLKIFADIIEPEALEQIYKMAKSVEMIEKLYKRKIL